MIRGESIPRGRLYSLSRSRQGAYSRNLEGYLARKLRVKEIAEHLNREPMRISPKVKKTGERLQQDRDFSERVEIMEKNLREKGKKRYYITIA